MRVRSDNHALDADLLLFDASGAPLVLRARALEIITLGGELIEARLTVEADPNLYCRIADAGLFGLDPEARRPPGADLPAGSQARIELALGAGMLVRLAHYTTAADAADVLLRWSREAPGDQLFTTERWVAHAVRPIGGEGGYTTLWADFAPSRLARELAAGRVGSLIEAVVALAGVAAPRETPAAAAPPLIDQVIAYLEGEGWPFLRADEQGLLQLAYQGENGTWTCFARVREAQRQLIFYSICPVPAPESRRTALSELLTRANYGLIIGNFELDLERGQTRYKTSLDAGEGALTTGIIRRAVAANVQTMDRYLPGILTVIGGEMSPEEAVTRAESGQ